MLVAVVWTVLDALDTVAKLLCIPMFVSSASSQPLSTPSHALFWAGWFEGITLGVTCMRT